MNPYLFLLLKKMLELEIEMIQIAMRDYSFKVSSGEINPNAIRISDIEDAIKSASTEGYTGYLPKRYKTCSDYIRKEWSRKDLKLPTTCLNIMVKLLNFFGPYENWNDFEQRNNDHPYAKIYEKHIDKSFWQLSPSERFDLKLLAEKRAVELVISIRLPEKTVPGYDEKDTYIDEYNPRGPIRHQFDINFEPPVYKDDINNIKPTPDAIDLKVTELKFYAVRRWSEWNVLEPEGDLEI